MMQLLDGLSDSDFQITCDCKRGHECRNDAKYIASLHMIGACNSKGLNENGERVVLLCTDCMNTMSKRVTDTINSLLSYNEKHSAAGNPVTLGCSTCRMPVDHVSNILTIESI